MITINSQLDMTPGAIPVVIHRSQYDSDFSIVFTLFARTGNFTIASGTTAKVRGTKKSGTGYSADATIDISAKTVTVAGNQQMTVASGQNIFEIVLLNGTSELCSANFILDVERAALDMDTITDDTVARELDNLEQFVTDAESAATRAETAAATFDVDATLTISGKAADAKAVGNGILATMSTLASENVQLNTWVQGTINSANGKTTDSEIRVRNTGYMSFGDSMVAVVHPGNLYFQIFEYSSDATPAADYYVGSVTDAQYIGGNFAFNVTTGHFYRVVASHADGSSITPDDSGLASFTVSKVTSVSDSIAQSLVPVNAAISDVQDEIDNADEKKKAVDNMFTSHVGNCGILCAKEHHYVDGTSPICEFYLLGDPATNTVYYSKDLTDKTKLFTFHDRLGYWSFGVDANNNIICCKQSEYLADSLAHDDSLRINPIVYLASERYSTAHTVDFGTGMKPCGWFSSVGFICLNNGDCLIAEYTRPVVETANIWKISGDPSNASNWSIKKTFALSGGGEGFKHIHCVQQDFYTGICYFGTGDDDTSSHIYYSTDNGDTWSVGKENSEKYCRLINFVFTEDWVYWSTDSNKEHYHFVFKAPRLSSGLIDFASITDLLEIPYVSGLATYGCVYFPEYGAILLLERADTINVTEAPVRVYDISTNSLQTVYTLKSVSSGGAHLGFRTRFADWYPKTGETNIGWHLRGSSLGSTGFNPNKMFGNVGVGDASNDINNARLRLLKNGDNYSLVIGTRYI